MLSSKKKPSKKTKELAIKTKGKVLEFPHGLMLEKKKLRDEAIDRWEQVTVKIRKDLRANKGAQFVKNISRLLKEEDLKRLRAELEPEEVSTLNSAIENIQTKALDSNEIRDVAFQLKKAYIEISSELKGTVRVALESMELKDHLTFIEENPKLASLHLQNLSPFQLSNILNEMETDEAARFLEKGKEKASDNIQSYENQVLKYKKVEVSPFARSLVSVLEKVGPSKERAIFDSLIAKHDRATAKGLALESFPSFLLLNLPVERLRGPLKAIAAQELAAFIICQEDSAAKDKWLNVLAEEGSKLKEMLMMEIEGIEGSESEMAKVLAKKEDILKKVYSLIKSSLKGEDCKSLTADIIEEWAQAAA